MLKECATFAGGCFWCLQAAFSPIPGVLEVTTGFMGGLLEDPTYEQVSQGTTDHKEVVLVEFDPSLIHYKELVEAFWQTINPTDRTGQFKDRGPQYTTAIFTHSQEQERIARQSKYALEKEQLFSEPIATQILPARTFYRAETHHQNYDKKHPREYQLYHKGSGREDFILEHWRYKPKKLTTLQESVLYENGTEPPFDNRYWNTKE